MNRDLVKMKTVKIAFPTALLLIALLLNFSCDRQKKMRGYDFIPDMVYSKAYDTYSTNTVFKDSVTMRTPVEGTIPQGYMPFRYGSDTISRHKAGEELVNPFQPYDEVIARGKLMYTTFCIGCHGEKGKGDGQLYSSGLYPLKPRDISAPPTARRKDGEIFHTITLGFGSMMPHGAQIKPEDRWKIVLYVRTLQNAAKRDTTVKQGSN
jgi:mono/diheme cytochrome c family protein